MNTPKLCRTTGCGQQVLLTRKAENTKRWAVLDANPVRAHSVPDAHDVRILDGIYAYRLDHMQESLDMRAVTHPDVGPVEDFPWHTIHRCKEAKT